MLRDSSIILGLIIPLVFVWLIRKPILTCQLQAETHSTAEKGETSG